MISIIVPVYNVENYLRKCIESIINQTYLDIEIIIIDDGSTDNSSSICDEYLTDNRIKVFHIKNQGVANARNVGIMNASSEYITFVDGDDFIEPDFIDKMVRKMEKTQSDLIICGVSVELEDGTRIKRQTNKMVKDINCKDYLKGLLLEDAPGGTVVWNKLFKKSAIKNTFQRLSVGEDLVFLIENLENVQSIAIIDDCLYHYVQRNGSARVSGFLRKHFDSIKCADLIVDYIGKNKNEYKKYAYLLQYNYYIGTLSRMIYWNMDNKYKKERENIEEKMKKTFSHAKKVKELSKVKKYSYWLYMYFRPVYRLFIMIYYKNTLYKAIK